MRKIFITVLLMSLAFAVTAETASILPSGVMRLTLANSYTDTSQAFDSDGNKVDAASQFTVDSFSSALEFGITDAITAAVQWTPTFNIAMLDFSNVTAETYSAALGNSIDNAAFTGLADLFVGAKVKAYDSSDMRFSVALGMVIPLDEYDPEAEGKNIVNGGEYRISSMSSHESIGIGARLYYDYQITDSFYVSLYNQTAYYLAADKYDSTDAFLYAQYLASGGLAGSLPATSKYEYGIELDFELEPNYTYWLNKRSSLEFGVPVTCLYTGETKIDDAAQDNESYQVRVAPKLAFFNADLIPFTFQVDYRMPLMGKNVANISNTLSVQLKLFYDFY